MLCVAETKIDSSFPTSQFSFEGYYSQYCFYVSRGGLLVYINMSIPTPQLKYGIKYENIQIIPYEINLRKERWRVVSVNHPPSQNSEYFIKAFQHFFQRCRIIT